jgi:hypothetical protein
MPSRNRLAVDLLIIGRKLAVSRVNGLILIGFPALLGFLWVADSYRVSFAAFLYLSPFLCLFFSQDMIHDEVHSGCLENVIFSGGRFRSYLLLKAACAFTAGTGVNLVLFSGFAAYGLATGEFEIQATGKFAAGLLVGVYYAAAAGFLSFYLRAGSNVLIILLAQVTLFAGFLFTASQRMGLIERLTAASLPGMRAKLEFLAVSTVLPNIIIARRTWLSLLGLGALTALFWGLLVWKIKTLELKLR